MACETHMKSGKSKSSADKNKTEAQNRNKKHSRTRTKHETTDRENKVSQTSKETSLAELVPGLVLLALGLRLELGFAKLPGLLEQH